MPLHLLTGMFSDGVNSLKELTNQRKAHANDLSENEPRRVSGILFFFCVCEFLVCVKYLHACLCVHVCVQASIANWEH